MPLREHERLLFHIDIRIHPSPTEAPLTQLHDILPEVTQLFHAEEAFYKLDNGAIVIRLLELSTDDTTDTITLLLQHADERSSNPAFAMLDTGESRIEPKEPGEGGAHSAHLVIQRTETEQDSRTYRALLEAVPGLNQTNIQRFLRHLFKKAATNWTFKDPDSSRIRKYRPLVSIDGHASERLIEGLREGELKGIELINREVMGDGFDEPRWTKERVTRVQLKAIPNLKLPERLEMVNHYHRQGQNRRAEEMRVRIRTDEKLHSIDVDLAAPNADNTLFIKYDRVEVETRLHVHSSSIQAELEGIMKERLVATSQVEPTNG